MGFISNHSTPKFGWKLLSHRVQLFNYLVLARTASLPLANHAAENLAHHLDLPAISGHHLVGYLAVQRWYMASLRWGCLLDLEGNAMTTLPNVEFSLELTSVSLFLHHSWLCSLKLLMQLLGTTLVDTL
jgi:hypothetical protein